MAVPFIQTALNAGEISPDMYGRVDLDKYRRGTSTLRNFFASYRGGAFSRAGTLFCGITRQGRFGTANLVPPPRDIAFQFSVTQGITIEAGERYFRFLSNGAYIIEAPKSITAISGVTFTIPTHGYSNGNELFLTGIHGPISLNNQSYVVSAATTNTFSLLNTLTGGLVSALSLPAYTGGGTAARIYEIATPYTAAELPQLKWAQSADVMTFVHPSHPPYDLVRISAANWSMAPIPLGATAIIPPPATIAANQTNSGLSTPSFYYQYVGTAVDAVTGEESIASPIATFLGVDQATEAATSYISCASVTGAGSYNFYAGGITYKEPPQPGGIFGYIGTGFGPAFNDTNVVPDFTTSPPLHRNPFATSSVLAVVMTNPGTSYSPTATTATATSPIGQDAILLPIIVGGTSASGGVIAWTSVQTGGAGYTGGEAVTFTDGTGSGSGAAATLTIGPSTGTFPSVVAYFQQRRFYANTNNSPDTYFASQPGAFTNMDTSLPVKDDDAIVGSPWSQQVNGIQWMCNMPGGLVILTGLGAWQLSGGATGYATAAAVTPSNQIANPQAYNGISPTVPPIIINYDILYVQERGSIVRSLSYNYFVNIYTGTDMTVLSNHLFAGRMITQWAWSEEPYKLIWAVRDDGILLCMTYLKEQDVYSWSRHDTNGLFQSVCSVSEPPVNAVYFVTKRLIQNNGSPVWVYMQERMDNRLWSTIEGAWCVDAGLAYPNFTPNAMLTVSSSAGIPTLTNPVVVYGGANYSGSTFAELGDPTGRGASISLTIAGGVITGAAVTGPLTGYTAPVVKVIDPTMAGGGATVLISTRNIATVTASAGVFSNVAGAGESGDFIRMNGRIMEVLTFVGPTVLTVDVLRDDGQTIQDDPRQTPIPAASGEWSIAAPVQTVYGLNHLEGMLVSILADGVVVTPQVVANGSITLPRAASAVVIGLGFAAQLQTLYLDVPGPITVQGRRKTITNLVVRVSQSSLPFDIGTNQPDASTQPNSITVPWTNMGATPNQLSLQNPLQPFELVTGDIFDNTFDAPGADKGQVAIQQTAPTPLNVLAVIPWTVLGDPPDV